MPSCLNPTGQTIYVATTANGPAKTAVALPEVVSGYPCPGGFVLLTDAEYQALSPSAGASSSSPFTKATQADYIAASAIFGAFLVAAVTVACFKIFIRTINRLD